MFPKGFLFCLFCVIQFLFYLVLLKRLDYTQIFDFPSGAGRLLNHAYVVNDEINKLYIIERIRSVVGVLRVTLGILNKYEYSHKGVVNGHVLLSNTNLSTHLFWKKKTSFLSTKGRFCLNREYSHFYQRTTFQSRETSVITRYFNDV